MPIHPLQTLLADADGFVLIGDSSADRFPGYSCDNYTRAGEPFHCLDLGGLTESRGRTRGGVVYTRGRPPQLDPDAPRRELS